jgi:streptomycin 6-kinase
METDWNLAPDDDKPETLAQHKAEFEKHGLTLLERAALHLDSAKETVRSSDLLRFVGTGC